MTVALTMRLKPPRWAKSYIELMLGLSRLGVSVDEDAVIARVNEATDVEIIDFNGDPWHPT